MNNFSLTGHVYAIADCGGAVHEGKCPECNMRIGGTSYRLAANNTLAPEMDGATSMAWSNEMNLDVGGDHMYD